MTQEEIDRLLNKFTPPPPPLKLYKPKPVFKTLKNLWDKYDVTSYCPNCKKELSKNILHAKRTKHLFFYCQSCSLTFHFITLHT
jgi:hypothetical protein